MDNFLNIPTTSNIYGADLLINQQVKNKSSKSAVDNVKSLNNDNVQSNLDENQHLAQKSINFLEKIAQPPCDITVPREYSFDVNYPPTSLKRHRHTKFGNHTYDPSAGDKKNFLTKLLPTLPKKPFTMPIIAELYFYEARPKSHYRTGKYSNELKATAPKKNVVKKDIDNFVKFVFDTLNTYLYKDDSQIFELKCGKYYSEREYGYITGKFTEVNNS